MIDESEQVERIIASSLVLQEIEQANDRLYRQRAKCFTKAGKVKDKKELKRINDTLISNNKSFDGIVSDKLAEENMQLPAGTTCGECFHIYRCTSIFGGNPKNTKCDFYPNRFARKSVDLNAAKSSSSESQNSPGQNG